MKNNRIAQELKRLKNLQQTTKAELRKKFKAEYNVRATNLRKLEEREAALEKSISNKEKIYASNLENYKEEMIEAQKSIGNKVEVANKKLEFLKEEREALKDQIKRENIKIGNRLKVIDAMKEEVDTLIQETSKQKYENAKRASELLKQRNIVEKQIEANGDLKIKLNLRLDKVETEIQSAHALRRSFELKHDELLVLETALNKRDAEYNSIYADFILEKKAIEPRIAYLQSLEEDYRLYEIAKASYDKAMEQIDTLKAENESKANELATWEKALEIKQAELDKRKLNIETLEKGE